MWNHNWCFNQIWRGKLELLSKLPFSKYNVFFQRNTCAQLHLHTCCATHPSHTQLCSLCTDQQRTKSVPRMLTYTHAPCSMLTQISILTYLTYSLTAILTPVFIFPIFHNQFEYKIPLNTFPLYLFLFRHSPCCLNKINTIFLI